MIARCLSFGLRCPDPGRTAAFYRQAFDATLGEACLRIGQQTVHLAQAGPPSGIAPANATSFQHFALVVTDMDAAYARLRALPGWSAITQGGPVRLPENTGGITAFKFRDPDGHPLELLAFPPDNTPSAWQGRSGLFPGIDHSAITVADTRNSVDFYKQFGFRRGPGSRNEGPAQARLDGLPDALVEVTKLALGDTPPHLELLCYRRPATYADARDGDDPLRTWIRAGDGELRGDPDGHSIAL